MAVNGSSLNFSVASPYLIKFHNEDINSALEKIIGEEKRGPIFKMVYDGHLEGLQNYLSTRSRKVHLDVPFFPGLADLWFPIQDSGTPISLLQLAIIRGHNDLVREILEFYRIERANEAVFVEVDRALCSSIIAKNLRSMILLLEYGANVIRCRNRYISDGRESPLYWALMCGHTEIAKLLIRHGALSLSQETEYRQVLEWVITGAVESPSLSLDTPGPNIEILCSVFQEIRTSAVNEKIAELEQFAFYHALRLDRTSIIRYLAFHKPEACFVVARKSLNCDSSMVDKIRAIIRPLPTCAALVERLRKLVVDNALALESTQKTNEDTSSLVASPVTPKVTVEALIARALPTARAEEKIEGEALQHLILRLLSKYRPIINSGNHIHLYLNSFTLKVNSESVRVTQKVLRFSRKHFIQFVAAWIEQIPVQTNCNNAIEKLNEIMSKEILEQDEGVRNRLAQHLKRKTDAEFNRRVAVIEEQFSNNKKTIEGMNLALENLENIFSMRDEILELIEINNNYLLNAVPTDGSEKNRNRRKQNNDKKIRENYEIVKSQSNDKTKKDQEEGLLGVHYASIRALSRNVLNLESTYRKRVSETNAAIGKLISQNNLVNAEEVSKKLFDDNDVKKYREELEKLSKKRQAIVDILTSLRRQKLNLETDTNIKIKIDSDSPTIRLTKTRQVEETVILRQIERLRHQKAKLDKEAKKKDDANKIREERKLRKLTRIHHNVETKHQKAQEETQKNSFCEKYSNEEMATRFRRIQSRFAANRLKVHMEVFANNQNFVDWLSFVTQLVSEGITYTTLDKKAIDELRSNRFALLQVLAITMEARLKIKKVSGVVLENLLPLKESSHIRDVIYHSEDLFPLITESNLAVSNKLNEELRQTIFTLVGFILPRINNSQRTKLEKEGDANGWEALMKEMLSASNASDPLFQRIHTHVISPQRLKQSCEYLRYYEEEKKFFEEYCTRQTIPIIKYTLFYIEAKLGIYAKRLKNRSLEVTLRQRLNLYVERGKKARHDIFYILREPMALLLSRTNIGGRRDFLARVETAAAAGVTTTPTTARVG